MQPKSLFLRHLAIPGFPQSDHTVSKLSADAGSLWNTVKQASRPQVILKTQPPICLDYRARNRLQHFEKLLNSYPDIYYWRWRWPFRNDVICSDLAKYAEFLLTYLYDCCLSYESRKHWYFVSKTIQIFFLKFEAKGRELANYFEISRTINLNSEWSEQFLACSWKFIKSNKSKQL